MLRNSKFTPEIAKAFIDHARIGTPRSHAAALLGVHRHTIENWLRWGEAEQPHPNHECFVDFVAEFRKAEAEYVIESIALIKSDRQSHKGREWHLKVLHPQEFGAAVRAEVSGPDGGPVSVLSNLPTEALKQELSAILASAVATDDADARAMGESAAGSEGSSQGSSRRDPTSK